MLVSCLRGAGIISDVVQERGGKKKRWLLLFLFYFMWVNISQHLPDLSDKSKQVIEENDRTVIFGLWLSNQETTW